MRNRGRGGIGLNPKGRVVSIYNIRADDAVNSTNGLVVAADSLQELASSLRRLEGEALASEDKKSQTAAGAAGKASRAASKSAREMLNALASISVSVAGLNSAYSGTYTETFSGVAGQILTETITGSWITTATVATAFSTLAGTSAYFGSFDVWVENIVAGSFDIKARNTAGAPANTYQFKWIATAG